MLAPEISQSVVLDPTKEQKVAIESEALPEVRDGEIKLKFLAAPMNPLDLAVISGVYPVKPQHYSNDLAVLGYDGLAEVTEVGNGVTDLAKGDLVIPSKHGLGTWRTSAVVGRAWVDRIHPPEDIRFGAIVKGSVMPAYFLIEDMVTLKPSDWIIVNAATSIISQYVMQFAQLKGVRVVSVIRDRDAEEKRRVERALLSMGSEKVLTESQLVEGANTLAGLNIVMAIDSVFGASGKHLLKAVAAGGTYVQLGFLGGPASSMPLGATDLWAKQITMRAFRGQSQLMRRTESERQGLLDWLVQAFNKSLLQLPALGLVSVQWDHGDLATTLQHVAQATSNAKSAALGQRKQVLVLQS